MARSAEAAMMALHSSGVPLGNWDPPPLEPWEGPFGDPTQRLPRHPEVAVEQREGRRRYRLRRAMREREAALAAAERDARLREAGGQSAGADSVSPSASA
jgi:hypothetical protein